MREPGPPGPGVWILRRSGPPALRSAGLRSKPLQRSRWIAGTEPAILFGVDAPTYDAVIIGGGPAGLTCALFLGRYRRRVLVLYDGPTRNYASRGVNGLLGHNGVLPGDLLSRGRAECEAVGVEFRQTRAENVARSGDIFVIETGDGSLRARRVVLAYGVTDLKPDIPRFEELYGRGIHHCPDCDGYESRDKEIVVVGSGKAAAGLALKMLQWSDRVRIVTNGASRKLDASQTSKLLARRIDVREERILGLEGDTQLEAIALQSGERLAAQALFFTLGVRRSCALAERIGCEVYRDKPNVKVNRHRETTVPGVYAVGDLVEGSQLVVTAAADGAIAAIALNKSLLEPARTV